MKEELETLKMKYQRDHGKLKFYKSQCTGYDLEKKLYLSE